MSPEERSAIYLNSIRKAMSFFVLLALAASSSASSPS
jgi:hypothetical protein